MKSTPLILPLLCLGCTEMKSSDAKTSGIYAEPTAVATEGVTTAMAVLTAGGEFSLTYITLEEGDSLEAGNLQEVKQLEHQSIGSYHQYANTFDMTEWRDEYVFSFTRTEFDSAPNSYLELPEKVEVLAPLNDSTHSRSDALEIDWFPSSDDQKISISAVGDCINDYASGDIEDSGNHFINSSDWGETENMGETCNVVLTIDRNKTGTLDPAFNGGSVIGTQRTILGIRLQP